MKTVKIGGTCGGGTLLMENGEIESCDIELALKKDTPQILEALVKLFETLGVAKGSRLIEKNVELPVGNLEGLALYLNGTELDDKVYKDCDVNHVIEKMQQLMGDSFKIFSYWTGNEETALYFYGTSFDAMKKSVEPFIAEYPLCEKSRIAQI